MNKEETEGVAMIKYLQGIISDDAVESDEKALEGWRAMNDCAKEATKCTYLMFKDEKNEN